MRVRSVLLPPLPVGRRHVHVKSAHPGDGDVSLSGLGLGGVYLVDFIVTFRLIGLIWERALEPGAGVVKK